MPNIFNDTDDTKCHVLGALQSDGLLHGGFVGP